MQRLRLLLLTAVAAGLALFFLPADGGRPLLSVAGVKARLAGLRDAASPREDGGAVRTIYRWRGEDGTWHYSNVRPADRPEAEEVRVPVSTVRGSGVAVEEPAAPGEPRSAGELLRQSRELEGKARARNDELERLMREADP